MKHKHLPHDPVGHVREILDRLRAIEAGPPVRTLPVDAGREERERQALSGLIDAHEALLATLIARQSQSPPSPG